MVEAEILGDDDETIYVSGEYHRFQRGSRNEYGAPMEPDEPEGIEVNWYGKLEDGSEVELTQRQIEQAEEAMMDVVRNHCDL